MRQETKECGMCFEHKPACISYEFSGQYQDRGYLCRECAEEVLVLFNAVDCLPYEQEDA